MKKNIMIHAVLFLSFLALTACPSSKDAAGVIVPNSNPNTGQTIPGSGDQSTNPGQFDSLIKSIQCEVQGEATKDGKFLGIRYTKTSSIPLTTTLITLDGSRGAKINLRQKFLHLFDIGHFGNITVEYVPGKLTKSGSDSLVLVNEGLNKSARMSQSGFGGQPVSLEAQSEGMYLSISCRGTAGFKSGAANTSKTNLACRGKSTTVNGGTELIEKLIPLNSIVANEHFDLTASGSLTAKLDAAATGITFRSNIDEEYAPTVTSSASLKSPATFKTSDGRDDVHSLTSVNVTCNIQ